MKQSIISMILLAGLVTMLASCAETFNKKTSSQGSISVSALGGPDTKTSYSGQFYEEIVNNVTHKYERIDWGAGDWIRIYSTDKTQVGDGVVTHSSDISDHYDYQILSVSNNDPLDKKSNATIKKPNEGEGLTWINDPYLLDFYGIYPPVDAVYDNQDAITGFYNMSIPASQSGTTPDMTHAYMVAKPAQFSKSEELDAHGVQIPKMHMDFYPLFNAFYIELQCESGSNPLILESIVLSSSTDNLSGYFSYNIGSDKAYLINGPVVNGVVHTDGLTKSVTADLTSLDEADRTITDNNTVNVTLLALPPQTGTGIKNMTLTVNYHYSGQTVSSSASLDLKKGNTFLTFPAFHKARITGLAMEGGSKWQLDIYTDVNKWTVYEKETSFSTQIGCDQWKDPNDQNKSLMVQGMWETGNHYADITGTVNGTEGYSKYYQIRTLKDDYFIVKFRPYAPVGGYWRVTPWFQSGDTASPDKFEILVFEEGDTPGEGTYSTDLTGQIMGNWVELHIKPKNYDPQEDDGVYVMMLHCDFSTSKTFDEGTYYSVDSEFQDVHGDGRYSYWRFTLDKSYTGGN